MLAKGWVFIFSPKSLPVCCFFRNFPARFFCKATTRIGRREPLKSSQNNWQDCTNQQEPATTTTTTTTTTTVTYWLPSILLNDALNTSRDPEIATASIRNVESATERINNILNRPLDVQLNNKKISGNEGESCSNLKLLLTEGVLL